MTPEQQAVTRKIETTMRATGFVVHVETLSVNGAPVQVLLGQRRRECRTILVTTDGSTVGVSLST
jgi:hypothetical protein